VPPYDKEIPDETWAELKRRSTEFRQWSAPPKVQPAYARELFRTEQKCSTLKVKKRRALWPFFLGALCLIVGLYCIPGRVEKPQTGEVNNLPQSVVPRATLVKSPPAARRAELVVPQTGQRYWVQMPDGRRIVINYQGEVADYAHLPVQDGITNAAYHVRADGNTWIWTVPATGANIATWIDP
jgi:hypothetical protein